MLIYADTRVLCLIFNFESWKEKQFDSQVIILERNETDMNHWNEVDA